MGAVPGKRVIEPGGVLQAAVYGGEPGAAPLSADEWEAAARAALPEERFGYVAGGAGGGWTIRANREAFERRRLRPKMLRGNPERDLSVDVLGTVSPVPFLLAPVGVLGILHEEGEVAVARACAATGVPFALSTVSSRPLEEVAAAAGESPRWFQLYWGSDREVVASFVSRAEAAGYGAIVVTVDTLILAWRDRDLRNAYLPFAGGDGLANFFTDPVFRSKLAAPPEQDVETAVAAALSIFSNLALTWDDLAWLRNQTPLPILVKGILRRDDARTALAAGADGLIVSNHGGRQVDGAVAALDALVEVREAVGAEATVLMDSGVRRGSDVLKALALGADAVLIGRPYAYALAARGAEGVELTIRQLAAELDITLALVGGRVARELDASYVA